MEPLITRITQIRARDKAPRNRMRWHRHPRSFVILWCCILPLALSAQTPIIEEPLPVEEPQWDQVQPAAAPAEPPPETTNPYRLITLEEELADPTESVMEPSIALPAPETEPSGTSGFAERTVQETESPVPQDSRLGVPSDTGFYLPDFYNALDPWFQMEGLRFRIWEFLIRFKLTTAFAYDDNIFTSNSNRVGDYITTFSPNLAIGIGDYENRTENYAFFEYIPQPQFFARNPSQNTVNEFLNLEGQYAFSRLVTSAKFRYAKDDNPNSDQVGRQENLIYSFDWTNSYALGTKTFLEAGVNADYQDRGNSIDYTTVSLDARIAYQFSPKLRLSLGPVAGITFVDDGGRQPFQGVNFGFSYSTLRKLDFRGYFGVQARQFEGPNPAGNSDFISPVFGLGITYQPRAATSLTLDLSRTVGNSGEVNGQSLITNRLQIGIRQRILGRIELGLNLRYDILQYQGTGTNERTDHYIALDPSLGYVFWRERCTLAIFYQRQQRLSEIESRVFDANTFGSRLTIEF